MYESEIVEYFSYGGPRKDKGTIPIENLIYDENTLQKHLFD